MKIPVRAVTERDLRDPRFRVGEPDEYEFRHDGSIARKDRWERGIHDIRYALGHSGGSFEVADIVKAVEALVAAIEPPPEVEYREDEDEDE
jgi:hypothetical protein